MLALIHSHTIYHKDMAEKSEGGAAFYGGDSYDMAVTASEAGFSSYIVIHNETAPTRYEFDVTLPTGFKMSENGAGGVNILNADDGIIGIIAAPWAFDADGEAVTTQFKLNGDTLVQTVEHAGVAYPVIADPTISYYGVSLNVAEASWCALTGWGVCGIAYGVHGRIARDATGRLFGDAGSTDDAGDAFRHCYWSARMTIGFGITRTIGALIAKGFGDRREWFTENADAKRMDLANNAHGRRVGKEVTGRGNAIYRKAESKCYLWSQDGTLQTSP